jgi:hypothetical protein
VGHLSPTILNLGTDFNLDWRPRALGRGTAAAREAGPGTLPGLRSPSVLLYFKEGGAAMDIFRLLRQDHAEALALLTDWVALPEGPMGAEAWGRWTDRWEVHVRIEENFLFPLLRDDPELRRRLAHAVEAHSGIRKCIQDMPPYEEDSHAWAEAVADLIESLERLVEFEERRLFPRARAHLPPDDAEDLALEVLDFLQSLRTALSAGS